MSGTEIEPNSPRYRPVKIVRQFSSTGSLASQMSSASSTAEVRHESVECHLIEIKPIECAITGVKQSRRKGGELSTMHVKQEANALSPVGVVKREDAASGNETPGPANTSNLIDELFKEFLSIKMETLEAEYQEKHHREKEEKDKQEMEKRLKLQAKDDQDMCTDGEECTNDTDASGKRHRSKEKSHKSKHKDKSHHKSSKHKSELRNQHGSRFEENSINQHSPQDDHEEGAWRGSDVDMISSQLDSPGALQIDIGNDNNTNGLIEITPAPTDNCVTNVNTQTIKKDPPAPVVTDVSGTCEQNSVNCHVTGKRPIPIVRVVAVKSAKHSTEKPGRSSRGTVVEVSTHLQQEASARAEKEDSLWDIALSSKDQDIKSDKEAPAPQVVFDQTEVRVKPTRGFKFGIKITEKSAELISSQNKEEGEVSGSYSDSENNDDVETGSKSGSDGEAMSGKKRKRKHRHRKRKKHKRSSGERERGSRKRHRSTSRSRTPRKYRHSRSRSRSTSRSRFRTGRWSRSSRSRSNDRHRRSRSRDREHHRHRSRSRSRGHRRSPLRGFYRGRKSRSRSWSRDKEKSHDLRVKIDKAKLRQIAIARAFNNMQTGQGPPVELKPEQLLALKAGGHSVQELTDYCKKISQKDTVRGISNDDMSDSVANEDEEETGPFIHHPFKLRDNQPNIVMNIANAKQLPILTPAMKASLGAELRVQFPVSSGSQHRAKEWVTVEKTQPAQATAKAATPQPTREDSVFPEPSPQSISLGNVVSERLSALRRLQSNPNDVQALTKIHHVDRQMESWASAKKLPGQFTGSTDIQLLSQQELHGGYQAWIRKDQFAKAAPLRGGIGMSLLQKMGWKQGEGLGKDNKGSLEPLALNVKMDRKGLSSEGENIKKSFPVPTRKDLSGKHPISALVELCNKKKWGPPDFIVVNETGPDHKKNFIIKVKVKGMEYQPTVSSGSKKLAKAQAATVCLQQLGLIPQ